MTAPLFRDVRFRDSAVTETRSGAATLRCPRDLLTSDSDLSHLRVAWHYPDSALFPVGCNAQLERIPDSGDLAIRVGFGPYPSL